MDTLFLIDHNMVVQQLCKTQNWQQKTCTCFASHSDGHSDQVVRCQVHRSVRQVLGYPRCHRTLPLEYHLPHIAPADAIVINISSKNWVMQLWNCCSKSSVRKAQNGPSPQLIEATSCIERSNAAMTAKELNCLSSYRTLTTKKIFEVTNHQRSSSKCGPSWRTIAVKLLTNLKKYFLEWLS